MAEAGRRRRSAGAAGALAAAGGAAAVAGGGARLVLHCSARRPAGMESNKSISSIPLANNVSETMSTVSCGDMILLYLGNEGLVAVESCCKLWVGSIVQMYVARTLSHKGMQRRIRLV